MQAALGAASGAAVSYRHAGVLRSVKAWGKLEAFQS